MTSAPRFHSSRAPAGAHRPRGFTLIELMVVVALLAIFAAVAVPAFATLIDNSRLQSASSSFYRMLQQARADAVSLRTQMSLCPNGDTLNWVVVRAATCSSLADGLVVQRLVLPGNVSLTSTVNSLSFRPDGTAVAASLQFSGARSSRTYGIRVAAAGYMTRVSGGPQ